MFQFEWSLLHSHVIFPTWSYSIVSTSDTVTILLFAMPSLTSESSIKLVLYLLALTDHKSTEKVFGHSSTEAEKAHILGYNVVKIHMLFIQTANGYSLKEVTNLMILFWFWKYRGDSTPFTMQSIWRLEYALGCLISRDLSMSAGWTWLFWICSTSHKWGITQLCVLLFSDINCCVWKIYWQSTKSGHFQITPIFFFFLGFSFAFFSAFCWSMD